MIRKIIAGFLAGLIVAATLVPVLAATPFQGYTYNFWGTLVPSPAAYVPVRSFGLQDIRCGANCGLHTGRACELPAHVDLGGMFEPTDLNVCPEGYIHVVDSGNDRIIVFDIDLNLRRVIDGYYRYEVWLEPGFHDGVWFDAGFYGNVWTDGGSYRVSTNWLGAGYYYVWVQDEESNDPEAGAYVNMWLDEGTHDRVWLFPGYNDGVWFEDGYRNRAWIYEEGYYDVSRPQEWVAAGYTVRRTRRDDAFSRPHGVFVNDDMLIYIADNLNHRVVVLQSDGDELHFVRDIIAPQIEGLEDDFVFLPQHVLVDRGGRTFVIVQRVFEGIMSFNDEGEFLGYFGTINVPFSPADMFWRLLMTEAQRAVAIRFIPREFQSMSMDDYGFVFTTHVETWHLNNQVMRLNPRGEDVLVNFNAGRTGVRDIPINGDQGWRETGPLSGMSVFTDIVSRSHGRYSTLCAVRGRIYTYDSEGNLLYVFSGTGSLEGMTRRAVSIETFGEDILLLDAQGSGRIIHFTPTEYGALINQAIKLRYDGYERYAVDYWRKLVAFDENFALAWSGIGRSYLAAGYNARAMYYLERGMDVRYFSVAFRRNRLDVMQDTLPNMMTGGLVGILAIVGYRVYRRVKKGKGGAE